MNKTRIACLLAALVCVTSAVQATAPVDTTAKRTAFPYTTQRRLDPMGQNKDLRVMLVWGSSYQKGGAWRVLLRSNRSGYVWHTPIPFREDWQYYHNGLSPDEWMDGLDHHQKERITKEDKRLHYANHMHDNVYFDASAGFDDAENDAAIHWNDRRKKVTMGMHWEY